MESDEFLIEKLHTGNAKAFETIYNKYSLNIEKFAAHYLFNKSDIDDAVQNVFITLWEKREIIRSDCKLINFLLVLTRNHCISKLREYKVRQGYSKIKSEEHDIAMLNIYALKQLHEDKLLKFDIEEILEEAINSLPEKWKEVFLKSKLEGFKHKEIAEELKISEKTIEKRITLSLKFLRKGLKKFLGPSGLYRVFLLTTVFIIK